ncbi:kiSS-1 receptor-like [Symsagittifera roscoffensis]|uniref:kiSS-1 receptor-like n=1 Tax=Symsagittifera roscoffensis TaxID=84072 RepID=UPI00307CA88F
MTMVSVLVSCFSLCLLSVDRCVALRYPLESILYRQPSTAIYASLACWLGALIIPVHKLFSCWPAEDQCFCLDNWSRGLQLGLYLGLVTICYFLPLVVILICFCGIYDAIMTSAAINAQPAGTQDTSCLRISTNSPGEAALAAHRNRQTRISKMVAFMAALFAVVWGPVHLGTIVLHLEKLIDTEYIIPDWQIYYLLASRALIYLGSSLNPIVYAFAGQNFRTHLAQSAQMWKRALTRCMGRLTVNIPRPRPRVKQNRGGNSSAATRSSAAINLADGTVRLSPSQCGNAPQTSSI